jgi:hypothetical protein
MIYIYIYIYINISIYECINISKYIHIDMRTCANHLDQLEHDAGYQCSFQYYQCVCVCICVCVCVRVQTYIQMHIYTYRHAQSTHISKNTPFGHFGLDLIVNSLGEIEGVHFLHEKRDRDRDRDREIEIEIER